MAPLATFWVSCVVKLGFPFKVPREPEFVHCMAVLWRPGVAVLGTCRELGDFRRLSSRNGGPVGDSWGWAAVLAGGAVLPRNGSVFNSVATGYGSHDLIRYLVVPALRC